MHVKLKFWSDNVISRIFNSYCTKTTGSYYHTFILSNLFLKNTVVIIMNELINTYIVVYLGRRGSLWVLTVEVKLHCDGFYT